MKKQLFMTTLAMVTAFVGFSANATSIQLRDYDVTNSNLNKTVFNFDNEWVFFDRSETTADLQIWNDVCPSSPGQFSCQAEAQIVLDTKFQLSASSPKDDACGISSQTSNKVIVGNTRHQLVVRNYTDADKLNCLLADIDYAIELHSEVIGSNQINVSYIDVKKAQTFVPAPVIRTYIVNSSKFSGAFFKNNVPDLVTLTIDHTNLKALIRMTDSPCKGSATGGMNVCLAMPQVILEKSFDILPEMTTMDKPYCNDSKFTSRNHTLDQFVPAVLGAKRNRASIVIHDATQAICNSKTRGYLSLELTIENFSKFGGGVEVINSKSKAKLRFTSLNL